MKIKSIIIALVISSFISFAQTDIADIQNRKSPFDDSCECISKIDRSLAREKQFAEVRECIEGALMADQMMTGLSKIMEKVSDTLKTMDKSKVADTVQIKSDSTSYNLTLDVSKGYEKLEKDLIDDCGAMNSLLNDTAGISSENSISKVPEAIKAYEKALNYYRAENFEKALKYYEKAVDIDKKFAFAWDMVGISHRRMGNYKKAVKAYKKSLRIDPRGKMPLQNLPIAYRMLDKWEKAADYYRELIRYYPKDPEGYFGLGQCGTVLEDYDIALDNMITAYMKYQESGSPYAKDAAAVLQEIYGKLKAEGRETLFMQYADKHGLEVGKQ